MIRTISKSDILKIQTIVPISMQNIDCINSAIYLDDMGNIKALVLTQEQELIDAFPNRSFPRTRQCRSAFAFYKKGNNHKIVFLYKADRNGYAINETFDFLLNKQTQGRDWWWLDESTLLNCKDEINKIQCLLCKVNNTSIYYTT
ncbi:MAG: hypothetical protein IJ928_03985 [Prevotella sp.]|nr:hypothetical protein [Prevotella sp.]